MKVLELEGPTDKDKFNLLYQGFVGFGNDAPGRNIEVTRREIRVLDALEPISDAILNGSQEPVPGLRTLKPGKHRIELEDADYDLLKRYVTGANWATVHARKAVAMVDWLLDAGNGHEGHGPAA